jgi:hypothetical protein
VASSPLSGIPGRRDVPSSPDPEGRGNQSLCRKR